MDTSTGDHKRLHSAPDEEKTNKVLYEQNVLSVQELIDKAKEILTKIDGKKEGVDFLVPYILLVYLQQSPLHEDQKTQERYTVNLTFKRKLLLCTDRDNAHPCAP